MNNDMIKLNRNFDRATANLGYNISESIMEGIDNAFDVDSKLVEIQVRLDEKENGYKSFTYIIQDDGNGTDDLIGVFDSDNSEDILYKNEEEYRNKNGFFHYGSLAHVNVASNIQFFSSTGNSEWKYIELSYDRINNVAMHSQVEELNPEKLSELGKLNVNLNSEKGSILIVKDVKTKEFLPTYKIEKIEKKLRELFGYVYYEEIKEKPKKKEIRINGKTIKAINPLNLDYDDDPIIKSNPIAQYYITLKEILEVDNDENKLVELLYRFGNIFSKDEILNQEIKVKLVSLNRKLSKSLRKNANYKTLEDMRFPGYKYGGYYIKRNKRYIGFSMGMLYSVTHPSQTRFRGEIKFNPIFDDYFMIQPNKNKNQLSAIIIDLIEKKLMADKNLDGSTGEARIKNALKQPDESNKNDNQIKHEDFKLKVERLSMQIASLKEKLEKYQEDTDNIECMEIVLLQMNEYSKCNEDTLEDIEKKYESYNQEFKDYYKCKYKDIDLMRKRIKNNKKRKVLVNPKSESAAQDTINSNIVQVIRQLGEPKTDPELIGLTYIIYAIKKNLFPLSILDNTRNDGLDSVIEIDKDIFEQLNMRERFGAQYTMIEDNLNKEYGVSYMEFRRDFSGENSKIEKSLYLVSHIISWEKPTNEIKVEANDGIYTFPDYGKKDTLLSIDTNKNVLKKVKIIYLKDMIKKLLDSDYKKKIY